LIKLIKVSKKYKNKIIFTDINLEINKTGIYSFIGENGSGKTTLLNIMMNFIKINKGKVINKNKRFAFISQEANLINHLTIKEHFIMFNLDDKLLKKVKLYNKLDSYPSTLSQGQKQRILDILAINIPSSLLVADEPTSHLDSKNSLIIIKEIVKASKNKLVLLVSHDLELVNKYSNQIYKLEDKQVKVLTNKEEGKEIVASKKPKSKFSKYIKKSLLFYKKINSLFILIFFIIFFLLLLSINLKNNLDVLLNNSVSNSLNYNKFYLKQCDEGSNGVKKCYNLKEEKIDILKNSNHKLGYNYDLLLNSLYESDKFDVINPYNFKLKEGNYPLVFNEIITNGTHKVGDLINLSSSKIMSLDKVDIYNKDLTLKVVGIIENDILLKNDNYYLDYSLIEDYLKEEYLINNKVSLYDYFKESDLNDYKYVLYFKNIDLDILNENNIEYLSSSYDYYLNISIVIKEIDKCLLYLNIGVIIVAFYYLVRLLIKKIKYKDKEIIFLKSMGIREKKIIKLINKEQGVLILLSYLISVFFIMSILYLVFKRIYFDYLYSGLVLITVFLISKKVVKIIVKKRIKI